MIFMDILKFKIESYTWAGKEYSEVFILINGNSPADLVDVYREFSPEDLYCYLNCNPATTFYRYLNGRKIVLTCNGCGGLVARWQ
jgi:hypothetical protein